MYWTFYYSIPSALAAPYWLRGCRVHCVCGGGWGGGEGGGEGGRGGLRGGGGGGGGGALFPCVRRTMFFS